MGHADEPVSTELVSIPQAQLHVVRHGTQSLLASGTFSVGVTSPPPPAEQRVLGRVGAEAFPLGKHLPALKAAPTLYSFGLPDGKETYYILVLPADAPPPVLEAVHDVLHAVCALTTVKQVDAAAEEADTLQGGKQSQALQEAEASGAAPDAAAAAVTAAAPPPSGPGAAQPGRIVAGRYSLPSSGNKAADKVAAGLLWGGQAVASAVASAAAATAGAIHGYADKQMAGPAPGAEQHAKISPAFSKGLALAGSVASSAAYVTGKLAALVGQASYATAITIAKSLPGHKANKAPGELATPEERSALHTVGAAGLVCFVDVYDELEAAAKLVFAQSAEATSSYISYKYGPEAGAAAARSVPVAEDMLSATINFSRLGARAFISKTAKKSASVYLHSVAVGPTDPSQPAAGFRQTARAMVQRAPDGGTAPSASGGSSSAPPAAAAPAAPPGGERAGSSNLLASPYPVGSSAAAAAAGQPGFNTAAAQQAARTAAGQPLQ